jgi:hypothetical protein
MWLADCWRRQSAAPQIWAPWSTRSLVTSTSRCALLLCNFAPRSKGAFTHHTIKICRTAPCTENTQLQTGALLAQVAEERHLAGLCGSAACPKEKPLASGKGRLGEGSDSEFCRYVRHVPQIGASCKASKRVGIDDAAFAYSMMLFWTGIVCSCGSNTHDKLV